MKSSRRRAVNGRIESRTDAAIGFAFLLVFFLSGLAALIYQIVWQRILTFFGGADVYSVTIIVSAFMGGLGFGSLAGGHLADRLNAKGRLLAFAACEFAVAAFAVVSTTIYYDLLYMRLGAWTIPRATMAAITFAVTLWPTFFMGMSLPLLTTAMTHDARQPARWVPLLYGWNTLGAACGSFVTTAFLFRTVDFVTSVAVGAGLSVTCAIAAVVAVPYVLRRRAPNAEIPGQSDASGLVPATDSPRHFGLRTWMAIYALSGFVALSLEIVWFRVLGVIVKSNSFTFGRLLAVYLAGVGLGALIANHRRVRTWRPAPAFFLLQTAIPVVAAIAVLLFVTLVSRNGWADPLRQYLGQYEALSRSPESPRLGLLVVLYAVVPIWLIGLPTLMMGLSFGHLQRAVQTDLRTLGRRVGWLQTANIVGSMAGAMLTGLALLDWLGSAGTLRLLLGCGAVFFALYVRVERGRLGWWPSGFPFLLVAALAYLIPSAPTFWAQLHGTTASEIIQAEDGSGLSVLKRGADGIQTIVHANGLGQSTLPYGGIHTVLGALPAMLHVSPKSVAVIGLGSGDTVFAIGGRPETRSIDSIEIIAPEIETLRRLDERRHYAGLRMLLQDNRVTHWFTDGRAFIRKGRQRYDIIEADALRPTSAYAGNLFSVEYFELLRDSLNPEGIAVTWAPTLRVVDSFVKAFPHVLLFEDLAIGSTKPILLDKAAIRARMQHPFTLEYYRRGGIALEDLLARHLAEEPKIYGPEFNRERLVDVNRDLFPKDEFGIE